MNEHETSFDPTTHRIPSWLWLLVSTTLIWLGFGTNTLWSPFYSFLAAVILLNILPKKSHWSSKQLITLAVLALCGLICGRGDTSLEKLTKDENLHGLHNRIKDRWALNASPSIFPRTLTHGHPQLFYIETEAGKTLNISIGSSTYRGEHLGHGLFRVLVQPMDALPNHSHDLPINLVVDGVGHTRHIRYQSTQAHPRWFCSGTSTQLGAVLSEESNEVFVFANPSSWRSHTTYSSPTDCHLDHELIVSHRHSPKLSILDPSSGSPIEDVDLGASQVRLASSPDGTHLAVALVGNRQGVQLIERTTRELKEFIPLAAPPDWLAFGVDTGTLIVSSRETQEIFKLSQVDGKWIETRRYLGRPVVSLLRSEDGLSVYISLTGLSHDDQPLSGNHFVQDQVLSLDTQTLHTQSQLITTRRATRPLYDGDFLKWTQGVSPMGMAELKSGHLLVAFAGSNEVWKVPANLAGPVDYLPVNLDYAPSPHGLRTYQDGSWAIASPSEGTVTFFDSQNQATKRAALAPTSGQLSKTDPHAHQRRLGEQVFYEATRSGRSCQSCHLHGDSDYATHNIGDTDIRPATLSARGVANTSPYLRGGDYNRAAHLIEVTEETFGGYIFEQPGRALSLESYIMALPPKLQTWALSPNPRSPNHAGHDAFIKARCVLCHTPPLFTNLSQHPVGSLFPEFENPTRTLDTPSLIGIAQSAPYLYDGRAKTLEDILNKHNASGLHGNTSLLDDEEKRNLITFLEQL